MKRRKVIKAVQHGSRILSRRYEWTCTLFCGHTAVHCVYDKNRPAPKTMGCYQCEFRDSHHGPMRDPYGMKLGY